MNDLFFYIFEFSLPLCFTLGLLYLGYKTWSLLCYPVEPFPPFRIINDCDFEEIDSSKQSGGEP